MKALLMGAAALGAVLLAGAASAEGISLGIPGYGGTGCPAGTVSATLSPDATSLSLIFDQYTVAAGGTTGTSFDRRSCNVAIPVHVPNGFSVSVLSVDYRGYNHLPNRAASQFNVEYFFAGGRGPSFRRSFYGPLDSDYTITNQIVAASEVCKFSGLKKLDLSVSESLTDCIVTL